MQIIWEVTSCVPGDICGLLGKKETCCSNFRCTLKTDQNVGLKMEDKFVREYRSGKTHFLKDTAGGIYNNQ